MEFESAASEHSSRGDKVYKELLEVETHVVARLQLDWPQEQENPRLSKLDDRFRLGGQGEGLQRRSLCFFADLHEELSHSWSKPYSCHVFVPVTAIYSTILGAREHGGINNAGMQAIIPGGTSSLKNPTLSTKTCRTTSALVRKATGQTDAALHTMAVLQVYQADLLKDLNMSRGIISEDTDSAGEGRRRSFYSFLKYSCGETGLLPVLWSIYSAS